MAYATRAHWSGLPRMQHCMLRQTVTTHYILGQARIRSAYIIQAMRCTYSAPNAGPIAWHSQE